MAENSALVSRNSRYLLPARLILGDGEVVRRT
jgi:hypothetical protein